MMRILLFLATNIAVMVLLSIVLKLVGFHGFMMANGTQLDLQQLLLYSAVIGFGGSFISLMISKMMAKWSMGVQVIDQPNNEFETWLLRTVARLAEQSNIKMPEVGIFDQAAPNAFATGWNKNAALVAVSTGLLNSMTRDEIEAVLGHEISHVANGDMVTLTLIQGVVNTFVVFLSRIIGFFIDQALRGKDDRDRGPGMGFFIASLIAQIVLGIFASMIVARFSRWREFRADAGGAQLAGRQKMIAALRRLQAGHEAEMPADMVAFGINTGRMGLLFASHPPLEERIRSLENQS